MKAMRHLQIISMLLPIFFTTAVMAQQRLEMDGTTITGNKELPNVLYIVPWKPTETVNFPSLPVESVMDAPLKPLDRNAFRRQIRYHDAIFSISTTKQ